MSGKNQKEQLFSEIVLVTNQGIPLNGTYYSCGYAIQKEWFIKGKFKLLVYYSPANLKEIYIPINEEYLINAYALNPPPILDQAELIKYQQRLQQFKELLKRKKRHRINFSTY
ncbi:hypothetical protein [Paenibacillus oryzisoli]|uniref:Transposase-like Mu C-terminal domain-containing protein n=1 Tax=Paenibacillus oryzisoli TaxID=1850517 RepID=A0A197ZYE2_9BACL|nr:hypothetical protein [Paenibacillus oryzisoli]OAS13748.1 hypothetical protein A8708_25240 [Paenibacillus oryzisoli]